MAGDRERTAGHRMLETWHPLGPVGIINRLQFPVAGLVVECRNRAVAATAC